MFETFHHLACRPQAPQWRTGGSGTAPWF